MSPPSRPPDLHIHVRKRKRKLTILRFPFHLRPKNKQALQYMRMAVDIVQDLELDQAQDAMDHAATRASPERMHALRTYLATQLTSSGFATTWQKKQHTLRYQNWTATCCEILAAPDAAVADQKLAWLVRLQHVIAEMFLLNKRAGGGGGREGHEDQHALLLVKGIEAQFREFRGQMSPQISCEREYYIQ